MTISIMHETISEKRLHEIYVTDDFYWYLRSKPFVKTFLQPIADVVNTLGKSCLDVACGEGQLAPLINVDYFGIDASKDAIQKANDNYKRPGKRFDVATLEYFSPEKAATFDTIVFGGVFHVLVKPEHYITLLEKYLRFQPKHFIIYDLEILNGSTISNRFELVEELHASVDMPDLLEVKRHRKILVYKCK